MQSTVRRYGTDRAGRRYQNALTDSFRRGRTIRMRSLPILPPPLMEWRCCWVWSMTISTRSIRQKGNPCRRNHRRAPSSNRLRRLFRRQLRATRELTLSFGVRYENFRRFTKRMNPGGPTVGLKEYFATRNFLQSKAYLKMRCPMRF